LSLEFQNPQSEVHDRYAIYDLRRVIFIFVLRILNRPCAEDNRAYEPACRVTTYGAFRVKHEFAANGCRE
jgi:hypothetical protein